MSPRRGGLVKLRRSGVMSCGCYLAAGSMVARLPQGWMCAEHALRLALGAQKAAQRATSATHGTRP